MNISNLYNDNSSKCRERESYENLKSLAFSYILLVNNFAKQKIFTSSNAVHKKIGNFKILILYKYNDYYPP